VIKTRWNVPVGCLPEKITVFLNKWSGGDQEALDSLVSLLYDQLRAEAGRHIRNLNVRGHTLQATVLINEAYMKFRGKKDIPFLNREHFFWFASRMIRQIIVDHIRAKLTLKRNQGDLVPLNDDSDQIQISKLTPGKLEPIMFLAINEAIAALEKVNPRRSQIVVLRFIIGTSIRETAEIMEIAVTTVKDEWTAAKTCFTELISSKRQKPATTPETRPAVH